MNDSRIGTGRPILTGRVEASEGEGFGAKVLRVLKALGHVGLEGVRYAAQVAPAFAGPSHPVKLQTASTPRISVDSSLSRVPTHQSRSVSSFGKVIQSPEPYAGLPTIHSRRAPRVSSDSRDLSHLSRGGRIDAFSSSQTPLESDIPEHYRAGLERIHRLRNPLGEAASRYLALSQPQLGAWPAQVSQGPTFLDQAADYRRRLRAFHAARQQRQPHSFQAQVQYTDTRTFQAEIWQDPVTGKNLEAEVSSDARVSEATVLKLQANLQRRWVQQPQDRETTQQAAAYVRSRITENWLSHDVQRGKNDLLYYRGVPLLPQTEGKVVYSDVRHVMRAGRHLTSNELLKVTVDMARGAFDFWIGEDLKTLQDPEEALGWRVLAGFSLATTFIPGGALEKAGAKIIKASSKSFKSFTVTKGMKALLESNKFEPVAKVFGKDPEVLDFLKDEVELTDKQVAVYKAFHNKFQDRSLGTDIYKRINGDIVFRSRINSKVKDGSYAIYETATDNLGNVKIYGKGTYGQNDQLLHWSSYIPEEMRNIREAKYIELYKKVFLQRK